MTTKLTPPASFKDVIALWPKAGEMAAEIGRPGRVGDRLVTAWRLRGSIPSEWFGAVVRAAKARPEPQFAFVTPELLSRLAEGNRLEKEAERAAGPQEAAA